jgi:hypothetical protein
MAGYASNFDLKEDYYVDIFASITHILHQSFEKNGAIEHSSINTHQAAPFFKLNIQ